MGTTRRQVTSSNMRYFTPKWLMDIVREIMGGGIELDPFSEQAANGYSVMADKIITEQENGLSIEWDMERRIWCNPPYMTKVMEETVRRLSNASCAMMICNSNTSSSWFQDAMKSCTLACFLTNRVCFCRELEDGEIYQTTRPERDNTLFLFSTYEGVVQRFIDIGSQIGIIAEFI